MSSSVSGIKKNGRRAILADAPHIMLLKLDIGCGPNPKEGFEGVDVRSFGDKVKHVFDIRKRWPWKENSVGEIWTSHFLEHLTGDERVAFLNRAWTSLAPDGTMTIIAPHWASNRAYGDPTHRWPPVAEMFFYYLKREWRLANAPHTDVSEWKDGLSCDFEATWGYAMHPAIQTRNQDYQQFALSWYKEAALDIHATLRALKTNRRKEKRTNGEKNQGP